MTCRGKRRHETRGRALKTVDYARDRRKRGAQGRPENRVYFCHVCKGWHTTSKAYTPKTGAA